MKTRLLTASLFTILLLTGSALGATRFWNGVDVNDNNWMSPSNWIGATLPTSVDNANFRGRTFASQNAHGELTNAVTIVNLLIGGEGALSTRGIPGLTLKEGSELTVNGTANIGHALNSDASDGLGELNIETGIHEFNSNVNIGFAAGPSTNDAAGTLTISNAVLNTFTTVKIGHTDLTTPATSTGTLNINAGSTFNITPSGAHALYVGNYGDGNINMNGGTLKLIGATKQIFVAYQADSTGSIEFNSGSITGMHSITVGKAGTGNLTVNGGMLSFDPLKTLAVGTDAGSTGTVTIVDGILNLGKEPQVGSGVAVIDIQKGLLMISDGAWRKDQMEALVNNGNITATGGGSAADDAIYSALYTAGTGSTNISTYITLKWGITANAAAPRTNAVWAVDNTPPPGTRLTIGYEGTGWPGGYHPTLTTEISIDGAGAVSSSNAFITVSLSGNPLPTNLYNTSFIYDVNGQGDLNEITGLGTSAVGLSIAVANDSIVTGAGIRNAAGDTALITHELDPGTLPAGYDIELWEIETRILGASEVATFIDLVNPANRLSVAGDGNTLQPNDVTGLDITVDSSSAETAFVSMCALTSDAATSYRLQTLTLNIVEQSIEPPPSGTYDGWMLAYTNELSEAEQAKDADPDIDGLENLMEYALGGDPTTNDAVAIQPTSSIVGDALEFLYNRRTNHVELGLSYYLELTPDLVNTIFTNDTAAYTVDGVSDPAGEFEMVTNSITTTNDAAKFITLTVED